MPSRRPTGRDHHGWHVPHSQAQGSNLRDGIPLAAGGVLHTLEAPFYPGDERPAATYRAQLLVNRGGPCDPPGVPPFLNGVALTALLLGTAP